MKSCLMAALLLITALSVVVHAADSTGGIVGTVRDATGAVIPGVSVTIRNSATNVARQTVTNAAGDYAVPQLPALPMSSRYGPLLGA